MACLKMVCCRCYTLRRDQALPFTRSSAAPGHVSFSKNMVELGWHGEMLPGASTSREFLWIWTVCRYLLLSHKPEETASEESQYARKDEFSLYLPSLQTLSREVRVWTCSKAGLRDICAVWLDFCGEVDGLLAPLLDRRESGKKKKLKGMC